MKTINYSEVMAQDRRLVILHLLQGSPGRAANHYVLRGALHSLGHNISLDTARADLAWLAEQGLIRVEELDEVTVATLTARGDDVGAGCAIVPGVKRPEPGA